MPNHIDEARRLLESRLADLDEERRRLERAVASLSQKGASRRPLRGQLKRTRAASSPTSTKPESKPRDRRVTKRAPRGHRREQLLAAIKSNPGARPTDLAKAIGVKPAQAHALIAKARGEKLIVKRGKGYALRS